MKIKTCENEGLAQHLKDHSTKYKFEDDLFTVYSSELNESLEIISKFKAYISDVEINKGTLNDVFLVITGKEIRG
jgi:ABC-2 type transport system ATP-binding protein